MRDDRKFGLFCVMVACIPCLCFYADRQYIGICARGEPAPERLKGPTTLHLLLQDIWAGSLPVRAGYGDGLYRHRHGITGKCLPDAVFVQQVAHQRCNKGADEVDICHAG